MALQKNIKITGKALLQSDGFLIQNIEVEKQIDSYIKVSNVNGNKNNIEFIVSYLNDNVEIGSKAFNFAPSLDGNNFIRQAYLHLKTLPEFTDAVDC